MASSISISGLGKRYRLGELSAKPTRITDAVAESLRSLAQRARRERSGRSEIWALRDVTLDIPEGQTLGVIGRNGSGKSTLLKILARITEPTEGRVVVHGRVGAVIELGTGFHPELTGRENIFLNGAILGMSRAEIRTKFDEIAEFSGVEEFLDTPVKRYSSGMKVRLGFAVAAHLEPEVLLIDEVLAVGDAEFQRKCLGHMADLGRSGRTVLFVSHNLSAVESLCDRVVWLDGGKVVLDGEASEVVTTYLKDRTRIAEPMWEPPPSLQQDPGVRLRAIRLLDAQGQGRTRFVRDEPIVVEAEVDILQAHPNLGVGFGIATQEGVLVFQAFHHDGLPRSGDAFEPGRWSFRCVIPEHLLNRGLYSLHVRIDIHQIRDVLHKGDVLQFEVQPAEGDRLTLKPSRAGVIFPRLTWEVESLAALEPPVRAGRAR